MASRSPGPPTPTRWGNGFFDNLFGYEWELSTSPAGAHQWVAKDGAGAGTIPAPDEGGASRPPTMLTTDLALRMDPVYGPRSRSASTRTRTSSPTRSPAPGSS